MVVVVCGDVQQFCLPSFTPFLQNCQLFCFCFAILLVFTNLFLDLLFCLYVRLLFSLFFLSCCPKWCLFSVFLFFSLALYENDKTRSWMELCAVLLCNIAATLFTVALNIFTLSLYILLAVYTTRILLYLLATHSMCLQNSRVLVYSVVPLYTLLTLKCYLLPHK